MYLKKFCYPPAKHRFGYNSVIYCVATPNSIIKTRMPMSTSTSAENILSDMRKFQKQPCAIRQVKNFMDILLPVFKNTALCNNKQITPRIQVHTMRTNSYLVHAKLLETVLVLDGNNYFSSFTWRLGCFLSLSFYWSLH